MTVTISAPGLNKELDLTNTETRQLLEHLGYPAQDHLDLELPAAELEDRIRAADPAAIESRAEDFDWTSPCSDEMGEILGRLAVIAKGSDSGKVILS